MKKSTTIKVNLKIWQSQPPLFLILSAIILLAAGKDGDGDINVLLYGADTSSSGKTTLYFNGRLEYAESK